MNLRINNTALCKLNGMALTIASLMLVTVRRINIIPSINTAVSANCHEYLLSMLRHYVPSHNAIVYIALLLQK